jgi:hypothetical protein
MGERRRLTTGERLLRKILFGDDHWEWTDTPNAQGYGVLNVDGVPEYAHVLAYELFIGPIPEGLVIDHVCHNQDATCEGGPTCRHRRCENPWHMQVVPLAENVRRGRGGINNRRKTHCPADHPYDDANTYISPKGRRECRTCRSERR